jgi:hypothetical protein
MEKKKPLGQQTSVLVANHQFQMFVTPSDNKTGNICINIRIRHICSPLLPWESNKYYIF